ncbi:HD domain-containing protein, partial [Streptococcus pyogenes]
EATKKRTQIEILCKDDSLIELSQLSPIVASLSGTIHGDSRFYFPKELLEETGIFAAYNETFLRNIHNDHFTPGEKHEH